MPPAEFEPAIPASERLQIHALTARPLGLAKGKYSGIKKLSTINPSQNGA